MVQNIAIGHQMGGSISTGVDNAIIIGYQAGYNLNSADADGTIAIGAGIDLLQELEMLL